MAAQIDVTLRLIDMMTAPLVRIQNEMERTARTHQRMGRDIQRIGDGFSSVGESMLPIAAGITAIGAAGGRAFIDFDSIITGAAAKAGATAEEILLLEVFNREDTGEILNIIKEKLEERKQDFQNYLPKEVFKLENYYLKSVNNYIILCISNDEKQAEKIINKYI